MKMENEEMFKLCQTLSRSEKEKYLSFLIALTEKRDIEDSEEPLPASHRESE